MPVTSYMEYIRDLKDTIERVRDKPYDYSHASMETAIFKNGYGYKSREILSHNRLVSEYQMGALNQYDWQPDRGGIGRSEIDEFFSLPEIYAYSDRALTATRNPLSKAHWDATIGLFEIVVCERNSLPRMQRMLFAGFNDSIHAEIFLTTDRDLIVHDHILGTQFFEWQTADVDIGRTLTATMTSNYPSRNSPKIER
jgi:hypothetical protein